MTFLDGLRGTVDFREFLARPKGVLEALVSPESFAKAFVEDGAVCWPVGIDLAPDAMYHMIRRYGTWVVPA